jgi:preprotein translocase subunit SecF
MAMPCIMEYSSFRFEWRTASGALLALVHDVVFVLVFCGKPNGIKFKRTGGYFSLLV